MKVFSCPFEPHLRQLNRLLAGAVVAVWAWCGSLPPATAAPPQQHDAAALTARFAPMELLFCFQGKGSCLPYDAGVLHEAFARLDAFRRGRVIVTGNSSGAIPAAFFGCHGFTATTVRHAEDRLEHGNRDAVRTMENVSNKIAKLSRGESTEISHAALHEFIAFALGVSRWQDARDVAEIVRRSTARPRFPCLIVACNKEVLEDVHPEDRFAAGRLKQIDLATMQVCWRPEAYAYYQQHPDRIRRDHPQLVLRDTPVIGRAMTFFVDQSMYDLLSQLPAAERQADLRLMTDAGDVALAILASASEPTYFPAVDDPQPEKILPADAAAVGELVRRPPDYGGDWPPGCWPTASRSPSGRSGGPTWKSIPIVSSRATSRSVACPAKKRPGLAAGGRQSSSRLPVASACPPLCSRRGFVSQPRPPSCRQQMCRGRVTPRCLQTGSVRTAASCSALSAEWSGREASFPRWKRPRLRHSLLKITHRPLGQSLMAPSPQRLLTTVAAGR
ncbi:MAG: hypothetical protein ACO37F_13375 [Pirellulales bacterium]